jgi:hypothetical protein
MRGVHKQTAAWVRLLLERCRMTSDAISAAFSKALQCCTPTVHHAPGVQVAHGLSDLDSAGHEPPHIRRRRRRCIPRGRGVVEVADGVGRRDPQPPLVVDTLQNSADGLSTLRIRLLAAAYCSICKPPEAQLRQITPKCCGSGCNLAWAAAAHPHRPAVMQKALLHSFGRTQVWCRLNPR